MYEYSKADSRTASHPTAAPHAARTSANTAPRKTRSEQTMGNTPNQLHHTPTQLHNTPTQLHDKWREKCVTHQTPTRRLQMQPNPQEIRLRTTLEEHSKCMAHANPHDQAVAHVNQCQCTSSRTAPGKTPAKMEMPPVLWQCHLRDTALWSSRSIAGAAFRRKMRDIATQQPGARARAPEIQPRESRLDNSPPAERTKKGTPTSPGSTRAQ